ncbi:uncharacterized protein LOC105768051 [Gossypium raimondii]|nr:uncharacterized protein LOC105768051 [Gossypium raimondii]
MLVQKRDLDISRPPIPPSTIRVRVYKSIYHEIGINSQVTFSKSLTLFYLLILKIHLDENLLCLTRDAKSDSVPDLQQQVVGLKVELCRLLEEKRSAILRSDELEIALMEMVKQDNRRQLCAKANTKRLQPVSGLLSALLVKYPNMLQLAQRAFITYRAMIFF